MAQRASKHGPVHHIDNAILFAGMCVSTMATYDVKSVAAAVGASHLWFQLYVFKCVECVCCIVHVELT